MRNDTVDTTISRSLRWQITTALAVIGVLVGGLGGIAAYAEISGAVIGSGTVIVEGRAKQVQHGDGGIIGSISVHEGEQVEAGELLFELDATLVRANLGIVTSQLQQLQAQEARLLAEQAGLGSIAFPPELSASADKRVELLLAGQSELFQARQASIAGQKAQLAEQIGQLGEKIAAFEAQGQAIGENIALLAEQIEDFSQLHQKGLILDSQFVTVRRENASLLGSRAALTAEIVEARQAIGEKELQIVQLDKEFYEGVLTELDQKRVEIARLEEEKVAAADRLRRLEIRSPLTGFVHQLNVHTIGGVVAPGETLLQIVPLDDDLVIETRLMPTDIDQVYPGQAARIRLTGLDQRVTPQLAGTVLDVSPDLTVDDKTGASFYTTRIMLPESEIARLQKEQLRPGMPVEVFIETNMRTVFSYLAKPLQDQIQHAMREN